MLALQLGGSAGLLAQQRESVGTSSDDSAAAPARTGADVTDDVLIYLFNILATGHGPAAQAKSPTAAGRSFTWFRTTLPLVCRRWNTLFQGHGNYAWNCVVVSVTAEHEATRKSQRKQVGTGGNATRPGPSYFSPSTSPATNSFAGTSPTSFAHSTFASGVGGSFARSSRELPAGAKLRSAAVITWAEAHLGKSSTVQHLLLDFVSSYAHDFSSGGHGALEALLRAANRGLRGLRVLRLNGSPGDSGQDSYEVLGRLKALAELHVSGLPQGFLAGTLPYLSPLTALTCLEFTPGEFQFPVSVPALPPNLRSLTLSELWLSKLPPLSSCTPHLTCLELSRCFLMVQLLASLASAPALAALHLDGSSLTSSGQVRLSWGVAEAGRWPLCPGLRVLSMAGCGLCGLPTGLAEGCPKLELLDLSDNPNLGGAGSPPGRPPEPATSAACLSPELALLAPSLQELRLAGCGLTALPTALAALTALTALDLAHNALSALPLLQTPSATSPSSSSCSFARVSNRTVETAPLFGEALVRLNISYNRSVTVLPSGLAGCSLLRELVVGAPLVAGARGTAEGEFERCVGSLVGLARLVVHAGSFDPRAVRALLAVQRIAAVRGRPVVEVAAEESATAGRL